MLAEWAIVMRDPFDNGRSWWAKNLSPRETACLWLWLVFQALIWALVLLR